MTPERKLRQWQIKEPAPADFTAQVVAAGYTPLLAQLLHNRKLETFGAVEHFFSASYAHLGNPFDIKDMAKAVERVKQAIANQEIIAIYGDYDTDGVTACSLLVQFFKSLNVAVIPRIPRRQDEGYGLNRNALRVLAEKGAKLVITVDCGISNYAEVEFAGEIGLDIIITDHHRPPEVLPAAYAILNPRQPDDTYPDKGLTGVGVAFHLVRALTQAGVKGENLKPSDLLDLVALGTIADVGTLQGENRILVKSGLKSLNKTKRPGIQALIETARLKPGQIDATSIGFMLAPRLNAAGRLDDAILSYQLLLTDDLEEARKFAQELERKNKERQQLLNGILAEARELIEGEGLARRKIIVIGGESWSAGVVGLVASRLCDEYNRPVIVMERQEGTSKGSARSPMAFNIVEALQDCADLLTNYGGHRQAAGFSLKNENLPEFTLRLNALANQRLSDEQLLPRLIIDATLNLRQLKDAYTISQQLSPFGSENPQPVYASYGLLVKEVKTIGSDNSHLRLRLFDRENGCAATAVAFRAGQHLAEIKAKKTIDVAYSLELNEWQGEQRIDLHIRDFK
jgi:single-stranded-DNA-specific exonuclease